jgi:RNA polymerase sigma-70 factor (ECF subfamily)
MTMSTSDDDQALFVRFQIAGDTAAFDTLYGRHKDAFFRYLRHLCGSDAVAADLFQHAWLKLLELARSGHYRPQPGASFRCYLYTLGRNHFVDAYHRRHEESRTESLGSDDAAFSLSNAAHPTPEEQSASDQGDALLLRALAQLPPEQREVAMMWSQGWSVAEIAELTRTPLDTIASRRKYAIKRLRELLAQHGPTQDLL